MAKCPVRVGSLVPYLPSAVKPGRRYEETINYPDLGAVDIDVQLDRDTYARRDKVKLELNITNKLSVPIKGLQACVTNHVLVEGAYVDINSGINGQKQVKQQFQSRSGDETVVDFSDIMTIEPNASLKRTYKMEVPRQVWPTCIIGSANVHPFFIRCYIDIAFQLKADLDQEKEPRFRERPSLAAVATEIEEFAVLMCDDERGLRIPLYVVDDREDEAKSDEYGPLVHPSGPFVNRGVVTWAADQPNEICHVCNEPFSVFKWRHHCRVCGNVVCAYDSELKQIELLFGNSSQRICSKCDHQINDPMGH